ncbi:hypothetical protein EVB91_020 [Rhizobium phage RHph_I1_18]|nr:hypothetical protein EVB91_020 [Rhizobium phage RHph_I1_18]
MGGLLFGYDQCVQLLVTRTLIIFSEEAVLCGRLFCINNLMKILVLTTVALLMSSCGHSDDAYWGGLSPQVGKIVNDYR